MNIPYLVGRRSGAVDLHKTSTIPTNQDRCDGNNSKPAWLITGWAAATFAAGAILGWTLSTGKRKK